MPITKKYVVQVSGKLHLLRFQRLSTLTLETGDTVSVTGSYQGRHTRVYGGQGSGRWFVASCARNSRTCSLRYAAAADGERKCGMDSSSLENVHVKTSTVSRI